MCLDRHKQRILRQPGCLLFHKRPEIRRFVFMEAGERRLQHMKPLVIHLPEVNLIVALRPLYTLQRLSCQPALFHQLFWVNQIRIARKRRKALVRRVAVAGGQSGRICQYFCPACFRKSTKAYASFPRFPMPYFEGSDVICSRIPLLRSIKSLYSVICRTLCRRSGGTAPSYAVPARRHAGNQQLKRALRQKLHRLRNRRQLRHIKVSDAKPVVSPRPKYPPARAVPRQTAPGLRRWQ